jgi:hypothetical protein
VQIPRSLQTVKKGFIHKQRLRLKDTRNTGAEEETAQSRDRCYDFLNIFAEIFRKKIGVFASKQSHILKKCDHNIGI